MTIPKTPRGKGRPWVAFYTSFLNDTELVLAGQDARNLYPLLWLHSAEQGLGGLVPSNPRAVQLFAHLDGGPAATEAALATLVKLNKLEVVDDDHYGIRTWDRYQPDFGGSSTRASSNATAALKRWHGEGKHADAPADGCPLCGDTTHPAPAVEEPAKVVPMTEAVEVRQKVWDRCDAVTKMADEAGEDRLEAYAGLYEFVTAQAPRFQHVKGIGEATLLNLVVDHAANYYLGNGKKLGQGTLGKIHGLRAKHGTDVLVKLAGAGDAEKPVGYFLACFDETRKAGAR